MEELRDLEKKRAKQEEMLRQKEVELMSHRAEKEKEYSKEISRIKAQMSKPEGYIFCNMQMNCTIQFRQWWNKISRICC